MGSIWTKDPDIILIIGSYWPEYAASMRIGFDVSYSDSLKKLRAFTEREGWSNLNAVNNKKVYSLHHGMIREMYDFATLQELAKIYYPELFSDIDPEDNLRDYFKTFLPIPYSGVWKVGIDEE